MPIQRQGRDDVEIRDIERRFEALVRKQGHWASAGRAKTSATLEKDLNDILREEMGLAASSGCTSNSQAGNKGSKGSFSCPVTSNNADVF